MAKKKGTVVDISSARKARGRGFPKPKIPSEGKLGNELSPETCMAILEDTVEAEMGDGLKVLLEMPPRMFSVGMEHGPSFSSNPGKTIMRLTGHILNDMEFPSVLPSYGIDLGSKGGNLFCVLIDRSRRIIVCQSVRSMYADKGSWAAFENAVRDALHAADSNRSEGKDFAFVISRDGLVRTI